MGNHAFNGFCFDYFLRRQSLFQPICYVKQNIGLYWKDQLSTLSLALAFIGIRENSIYEMFSAHNWASPEAMIILSVILSVLTYQIVEKNVRKSKGKKIIYILGSGMVLLLVVCVIALHHVDSFSLLKYFQKKGFEYEGSYEKPPFVQRKSISYPTGLEPTSVDKLKYSPGLEDY